MVPMRSIIWVMLFTCTFVLYMLRTNLSIIILAMVEPSAGVSNRTSSVPECVALQQRSVNSEVSHVHSTPHYGVRYDWDTKMQGMMLGAYFWGFVVNGIPAGPLSERFGPRKCVAVSFLVSTFLTLVSPLAASIRAELLIASRFFIGLFAALVYPACHGLISKWAPPAEKGKFVSALLGGNLGTVITWPMLGSVIENISWEWAFYITGIVVLLWSFAWIFLVFDHPDKHPWISPEEKEYINKSHSGTVSHKKRAPPYKQISVSVPAWALVVAQFGNLWGLFFLMTAGPIYLSTVLGFDLGRTGFLAALPYLARMIAGFGFGAIGDFLLRRGLMSKTKIRKWFTVFSHIVPGLFLIIQTTVGCEVNWAIALITLSLASNGASTITNLQNAQDLAPNFAGSMYAIANCIGSTTGFISPLVVGHLTAERNGIYEWQIIFYIGAAVYIACGLFFIAFGSGEVQPWNYEEETDVGISVGTVRGTDNKAFDSSTVD
ncbi:sialin-like [Cylas formicarius]|uniref:sialin-like n=1 Tax=Cylas formicarius TaxID=197179 RepID=UPI0029589EB7|nr:sialin-like [Cylas formicarius]